MTTKTLTKPAATEERNVTYVPFGADASQAIRLTIPMVRDLIAVKTKSGATPTDQQIIKFMMLCKARRLNPFEGDAFLVGYDSKDGPSFSLITAHQAFLKRAEASKDFDGMESGAIVQDAAGQIVDRQGDFILDDDTLVGAWAIVHIKGRKVPSSDRIGIKAYRKGFGRWNDDPAGMLVKCAEASALRKAFPTMLGGMYLDEEMPAEPKVIESTALPTSRQSVKNLSAPAQQPQPGEIPVEEPDRKAAILALATEKGWTQHKLRDTAMMEFGVAFDDLSSEQLFDLEMILRK